MCAIGMSGSNFSSEADALRAIAWQPRQVNGFSLQTNMLKMTDCCLQAEEARKFSSNNLNVFICKSFLKEIITLQPKLAINWNLTYCRHLSSWTASHKWIRLSRSLADTLHPHLCFHIIEHFIQITWQQNTHRRLVFYMFFIY